MKKWIPFMILVLLLTLPACNSQKAEWTIGKKSSLVMDDTIEISIVEKEKTTVQFQLENPTQVTYCYGRAYRLEVRQDGEWYQMVLSPSAAYTLEEICLRPGEVRTDSHAWPCELPPGQYRLIKEVYPEDAQEKVLNIAAEFTIEDEKASASGEKEVLVAQIDYPYYDGVEDLARDADYIVHGKVIDKTCQWRVISMPAAELYLNPEDVPPAEEDLVTVYQVQVLDSYLPTAEAGDILEVMMMGGETETAIHTYEGIPELSVDDSYVFFLSKSSLFENAGWPLNPSQAIKKVNGSQPEGVSFETLENLQTLLEKPATDAVSFSDYAKEELQVYYCDLIQAEDTRIRLSEEQEEELLRLLEPYGSTLTTDVLKTDFTKYYRIRFGFSMTATIDAERGKYGDQGDSYLFAMEETPGAYIKGTYVDADILDFLSEQLAEEGT